MHSVEDADPQGHEGLGEVDDLLPFCCDSEGCHSQVCLLLEGKQGGVEGRSGRQKWAVREKHRPKLRGAVREQKEMERAGSVD
jgi:hypothetical protein